MLPLLKVLATVHTVLFYPAEPMFLAHPDSMVFFDPSNVRAGTEAFSYTAEGWLGNVRVVDSAGTIPFSTSVNYSWKLDTLYAAFSYSPPGDMNFTKCIFDANGFPVRQWSYDTTGLVEIESYVYSASGKLTKDLIQNPNSMNSGDSIIYAYDAFDHLISSTQYGSGTVWSLEGFNCDASGRIIRYSVYDCSTQCTPSGSYGLFYYSKNSVRRNPVSASRGAAGPLGYILTSNQFVVTSNRPGTMISAINIFTVSGALISSHKATNGYRENPPVFPGSDQMYLCAVETNTGRVTFKIRK